MSDKLSEALGIEPIQKKEVEILPPAEPVEETKEVSLTDDAQIDYEMSRRTFRSLIDKGNMAMENLTDLAKESESPRAYEVLATMMKTIADTTKDLYDLQKKTKDLKGEKKAEAPQTVNNIDKAVFVGTTADLLKQMKENNGD
jgi:hypothetical protein